jgi:hypothetical protein
MVTFSRLSMKKIVWVHFFKMTGIKADQKTIGEAESSNGLSCESK